MKKLLAVVVFLVVMQNLFAQSYPEKIAATIIESAKEKKSDGSFQVKSLNQHALLLKGMEGMWLRTGDKKYFDYIHETIDLLLKYTASIPPDGPSFRSFDDAGIARRLLLLYKVLGDEKYYFAASSIRDKARKPSTERNEGLSVNQFCYRQERLDNLSATTPFYAEWAKTFEDNTAFDTIAREFIQAERNFRDTKTGLLNHKDRQSMEGQTIQTSSFSTFSMGQFGMALVDVLETFPEVNPYRDTLVNIFSRFATAIVKYQDKNVHLWLDPVSSISRDREVSNLASSCLLIYTLAKGVRIGALSSKYLAPAQKAYLAIVNLLFKKEDSRHVASTGGASTKFDFATRANLKYVNEKVIINDPVEIGAFLLAGNEVEIIPKRAVGKNKLVLLDYYLNHEVKKDINGKTVQWHYIWDEMDNNGYSLLGEVFKQNGAIIGKLNEAPVYENLSAASVYIIVDPDNEKESPNPNYMQPEHVKAIYNWVIEGGVLALFLNDSANAEFDHINTLSEKFGIHFNRNNKNRVEGNNFEGGAVPIPANHSIFKTTKKGFIKELSTLTVSAPAQSVLQKDGNDLIAVAKLGHGFVFAVGDPWFYNEYLDGRKLPVGYENYHAAQDLVKWLLTVKTNKTDIIKWNTTRKRKKRR